jgi:hypothetical protein
VSLRAGKTAAQRRNNNAPEHHLRQKHLPGIDHPEITALFSKLFSRALTQSAEESMSFNKLEPSALFPGPHESEFIEEAPLPRPFKSDSRVSIRAFFRLFRCSLI